MRGRYTAGAATRNGASAGCCAHPPLHRESSAAEIEPVSARELLRFLFEWQRVAPEARMKVRTQ